MVGPEASVLGSDLVPGSTEQQGGKETMCEMEVDQIFMGNMKGMEKSSLLNEMKMEGIIDEKKYWH